MAGMREMWREATPVGAIADLRAVYVQAGRNRWWFLGLAALTTFGIFSVMVAQEWKKPRPKPEITYITSWPEHRTDAETKAFIEENQRRKEAREDQLAKASKAERDIYKALGKMSGMDVEAIERKADAERAKEEAAAKAKTDALLKQHLKDSEGPAVGGER
jgi:hypothetical protein